jgi:hypothetical protein
MRVRTTLARTARGLLAMWGPLTLGGCLALCACAPAPAGALQRVRLTAGFSPDRLDTPATISFAFTITAPGEPVPSPLTSLTLHLPAGIGLARTTLGLSVCEPAPLVDNGADGCPENARIGYGSALAEVPYGPVVIHERVHVTTFRGVPEGGNLTVLFFAEGWSPVYAQLAFPATVAEETTGAFGGRLDAVVPVIPSVPYGPDVAVAHFQSTIGPSHILYHRRSHGHTIAFRPRGVTVPAHCPRGGFPFAAAFSFQDGTHTIATARVPCPRALTPRT